MSGTEWTIPGGGGTTLTFSVSGAMASTIAQAFSSTLASLQASGKLTVTTETAPGSLPAVPPGDVQLLIINDTTPGATFSVPAGYNYVLNESSVPVTIDASSNPNFVEVITPGAVDSSTVSGSTTMYGGTGGGADVSNGGNNLFVGQGTGGGQFFIAFASGSNTVWANSGNDVISPGSGSNVVGLGSGNVWVTSSGSDTLIAGPGNDTVYAQAGASDLLFGSSSGGLLFVGGPAGTSSTIVGAGGPETLYGGSGTGLFFVGTGPFMLDAQHASDTVVAGATSHAATIFGGSGASVTLFSASASGAAGNLLIAGSGNETLNAAGSSRDDKFWAGNGDESLGGGSGSDIFAFVNGTAHGADTIGGWTSKDTLVLQGFGSSGLVSQTPINGNDLITLSDGTTITVKGVSSIPSSHIFLS